MGDWISAAIGVFLTGISAVSLWRGVRAIRWPTTTGRVIEASINKSRHGGLSGRGYEPRVLYQYEVGGIPYTADRLTLGLQALRTSEKAAEKVLGLRRGDSVQVHYNPRRPSRAVLRPGATFMTFWALAGGLFFLISMPPRHRP